VVVGLIGLVIGWSIRGVAIRSGNLTPGVSWFAVGIAFLVAAVVGGTALLTWRTVRRARPTLTAQEAVGRLVLGKATARLAAFGVGAYVGVAISHFGVGGEDTMGTILRASLAAVGAAAALVAGLLLEHACRVPPEDR
jgi:hypothetical protein